MKLHSIIFIFIFVNWSSSLYPQDVETSLRSPGAGKRITVVKVIPELEVMDSLLLKDIDSLVLNANCPYLNDSTNRYFACYIKKSYKNPECYDFVFELYSVPIAEYGDTGYFEYKGYTFFVGDNALPTLFKRKNKKKKFTYKRGEMVVVEEFPMWSFLYTNNRLILLEHFCW